jgi:hypothetical protein
VLLYLFTILPYTCFLCKCFSSSVDGYTHASHACIFCILAFYASIFHCWLTGVHMLLMHAFFAHLLSIQVFFIISRWVYTCFSCMYFFLYTCFLCKYFSSSVDGYTHTSHAYIFCTLAFYASIFHCQLTGIHMLLMHVFFLSSVHVACSDFCV